VAEDCKSEKRIVTKAKRRRRGKKCAKTLFFRLKRRRRTSREAAGGGEGEEGGNATNWVMAGPDQENAAAEKKAQANTAIHRKIKSPFNKSPGSARAKTGGRRIKGGKAVV